MTMVSVDEMKMLTALQEAGSLGKVARRMQVSQPAISMMLRKLETRTGLSLVERSHGGSSLSEAGVRLANLGVAALKKWSEIDELVSELRGEVPLIRIAASQTIAEYLVPKWMSRWPTSYRNQIELTVCNSMEVMDRVFTKNADIGFTEGATVRSGLQHIPVAHDRLSVVVSPLHPWVQRVQPVAAEYLLQADLALRESGSGTREVTLAALGKLGVDLPKRFSVLGSTSALKNWAKEKNGVAIVSELTVRDEIAGGALVEVSVDGLDLSRVLHAVFLPATEGARARFIERFISEITAFGE